MNHEELKNLHSDYISSIDIGTTKIVAIIGKKDKSGKIRIMGMGSTPTPTNCVKRGVVLNINEVSKAIKTAVGIAEEKSGLKIKDAYVGIAGQHIKSQVNSHSKLLDQNQNEVMTSDIESLRNDMYNMAMEAGEETIHVIPQSYQVDKEHGVANPVGMFGRKLTGTYHIVIGDTTAAKNIIRCVNRIDIKVNKLILEPLASASAVLTEDEKEAGVVLVDIGGGTTDIAIYYDGILRHTAVIPYGGHSITQDIKKGYSILNRYAEELKTKFGFALAGFAPKDSAAVIPGVSGRETKEIHLDILGKIIQSRMEEIFNIVSFEIDKSGFRDQLGAGIALTGGGSQLRYLAQLVNFKTGLSVRVAAPVNYLVTDERKVLKSPVYSTAIGLILQGFDYKLLNEIYKIEQATLQQLAKDAEENDLITDTQGKKENLIQAELTETKNAASKRLGISTWIGKQINTVFGNDNNNDQYESEDF